MQKTNRILSRTLHLQRKERNHVIPWHLCSSCGFCRLTGTPGTILLAQLCSAGTRLPAPAELLGVNIPGNINPWLAMATPQFPSSLACWDLPMQLNTIFYVLPMLLLRHWVHLTEWIPTADELHRQCSVHLPSTQRKNRYFLNCWQTASLTSLFWFLPCPIKVQVSPWPQDCWSVGLPGEFGCWWVGIWLRKHQGAQLE